MPVDKGSLRRRVKVDKGLRFYHEILGLDHLQYGLWDGEPLTLDGLRSAQERYAQTLHRWIPEGVQTILDIGCGTGASAARMLELGYEVEGLSPDPFQKQVVEKRTGMPFNLARLQEFEPKRTFDLAIMSESSQYIWLDVLFPDAKKVAAGGHLLIADYFLVQPAADLPEKSGHPLDEFLAEGERQGFELLRREDVTEQVLPTLDLAQGFIERYAMPTANLAVELFAYDNPRLFKLIEWLGRKKVAKERAKLEFMMDRERFAAAKRYLFLLYRVPD
ncbi:MAG: class I SAM-dependent methyltransferase [Acidobacteriota bacterium]